MLLQDGSTCSIGYIMDQIDASVAPPRLISCRVGTDSLTRAGKDNGIQSPLMSASLRLLCCKVKGEALVNASNISSRAGTLFQSVTRSRANSSSQSAGSR